jgi:tRNA(Ile)-lysidine synthase
LPTGSGVTAFAAAVGRLTDDDNSLLLLAVSGGPDSIAMLLLAKASIPDRIRAATVDHGLRKEAATEAAFVASLCSGLGIPHKTLQPDAPIGGNIQSGARAARYELLEREARATDCRWIATAHHADDQLETVLMRVARGSGVDGLSGIRAQQGRVIRPMLSFSKRELEAICDLAGVKPLHDPSNDNAAFDRVAMRQWLETAEHPFDAQRAVRSAAAFADAAAALQWAADKAFEAHVHSLGDCIEINVNGLPAELCRRLLQRVLVQIEPGNASRGDAIDRALTDLSRGKRFTLGNVLCEGGEQWSFRPAPERRQ